MTTPDAIDRARGLFLEAALDPDRWIEALDAFAAAGGGWSGQLVAVDGRGAVAAHWLSQAPDGFLEDVEAFGLTNPAINPRIRIGMNAAPLALVADQDHVDRDDRARHPIYADLFERHGYAFNCQTVLAREPGLLIRASISRTAQQGAFETADLRAMAALAPSVQAAVRFQRALDQARTEAVLQTIETLSAAAFLIDASGRVVGLSSRAEALAREGRAIRVVERRLRPALDEDAPVLEARLAAALEAARRGQPVPGGPFLARAQDGGPGVVFEIQPLALDRRGLGEGPAVMVVERSTGLGRTDAESVVRQAFGLTAAEAGVALRLADGADLNLIADERGVTRATVRSQLQAIYAKARVRRQAELIAALRRLV